MTLVSTWPAAAAEFARARRAIGRFLGPVERRDGASTRMPPCVSYGRAVFCLHLHEPRASQAPDAARRR